MIAQVGKAFNMRRDEMAPASLLFLYLFLAIGAFIMGQAVGDSLFLNVFPLHLPYAMMGSAVLSGTFVLAYIRLSHRLRLEPLIVGALLFFAVSFTLFWWLTRLERARWVYMLVYVWVQTEGAMAPMMGWTLANYLLTTREARRVFGFIQLGAILGVPFVGFLTADVMHHGHATPSTLLLVLGLTMALCALLVKLLFGQAKERLAGLKLAPTAGREAPRNLRQSLDLIRRSRYLLLVTALVAVGCLASSILVYQFKLIAKASYGADKSALTGFFGRFYGYMGLVTFLFQLLATGPLLRSFGIRLTLFVLPLTLMAPTLGVMLAPMLLTASLLRGSHYALRYSLDKSSTELLYLPVAADVKSQAKSFIDTFVYRFSDGIAGVLLLVFASLLKFSPGKVSLINLVVLAGWVAIALGVRREYLNVLKKAIERRTLDPERTVAGVLDSTTTDVMALCLERGQERQLLYGLSLFEMGRGPGFHPALRGLLDHASPSVRQRALRLIGNAGDLEVLPRVEKLLEDESLEVRTEALHYLVVHTGRDPLSLLTAETKFPDYCVQSSVVAYLARLGDPENLSTAQLILHDMIARTGSEGPRARAEAARVLGVIPPPSTLHADLLTLLRDENPEVLEEALRSAGKIQSREYLSMVIEKLGVRRLVAPARLALAQYGERAVGTLEDYLKDAAIALPVRKQIPHVLARIPTRQSATALADSLLQSDPGLRYEVLKALNKLRRHDPALLSSDADFTDLVEMELMGYYRSFQILAAFDPEASAKLRMPGSESVLTRAMRERMDHELERIFRLLALIYPPRDLYNAFVGLTSGRPQLHANALEVLEHMLRPELYRQLAYGLDPEIPLDKKMVFAEQLCGTTVASKAEALRILMHSADGWMCACAVYAVGELQLRDLLNDLRRIPHEGDPLLDETWKWANARLEAAATA